MDYQRQHFQQGEERAQQERLQTQQQTFYEGGYQTATHSEFLPYTHQPVISKEPPVASSEQLFYRYQTFQPLPHRASNDNSTVLAVFSYVLGWFSGLLVVLFAGQNRYARFHGLQSLLFFGAINLIDIFMLFSLGWLRFMSFFAFRPFSWFFGLLFVGFFFILNVVAFVAWIIGIVQAASGKYYQMPFVGRIAARVIQQDAAVK